MKNLSTTQWLTNPKRQKYIGYYLKDEKEQWVERVRVWGGESKSSGKRRGSSGNSIV